MKESELRECTTCGLCVGKILASGVPLFWRVTIERFGVDVNALKRQDGLTAFFGGNALLALHMGADEDMAKPMMEPVKVTVCEPCALSRGVPIAAIAMPE